MGPILPPRRSIRREIVLFGIAYAGLGVSGIALASAKLKQPLPEYERVLLLVASGWLLLVALGAFLGRPWTWRRALAIHLILFMAGVVATAVQLQTRDESENLFWLFLKRLAVLLPYLAMAFFWLRRDVKAELARRR